MQGNRATVASLSDLFDLEHGSSTSDGSIDWSNLSDNHDPENLLPPSSSIAFMNDHLLDDRGYDLATNNLFSVGQSSRPRSSTANLDIAPGFVGHGSADSPLVECPDPFKSSASNNQWFQSANSSEPQSFLGPSGSRVNLGEDIDGGTRDSLEGRLVPCKRKSFEGQVDQSSVVRRSGYHHDAESSNCPDASSGYNSPISGGLVMSQQAEPRLRLGARGASSRSSERVTRNSRARLSAPGQHSSNPMVGSELLRSDLGLVLSRDSSSSDANAQVQPPELHIHSFPLAGTHRVSAAGTESSREAATSSSRNTIENHPIFITASDSRALGQSRSSGGGGSIRLPRNFTPSQSGASSSIQPPVPHRPMHYPRELSEYVRRSLSAVGSEPGGGPSSSSLAASGPSVSSIDAVLSSRHGTSNNARQPPPIRPSYWSERHSDESLRALPYSIRALAAAGQGRRRLTSEMCSVLDMIRRGQGFRIEDLMILDQTALLGVADTHDRHRDMRLDVDNMSYEELLALEERIGNVNTGLREETILVQLKQRKCVIAVDSQLETEPCCICQEEYADGQDLGTLECGHDFHRDCIKQWLMHKNLCPICKTTGIPQ